MPDISFNFYASNNIANDITTMTGAPSGNWSSSTNTYLTTQEYVDKQIWNQTLRLNKILDPSSGYVESFNTVYQILNNITGTDGTLSISNLIGKNEAVLEQYSGINLSITKVANQSINPVQVLCSPNVWADECAPLPIPSHLSTSVPLTDDATSGYGGIAYPIYLDGWWFSNSIVPGSKINWYVPAQATNKNGSMSYFTVSQLNLLYLTFTNLSDGSGNAPWISLFTAPKGTSSDIMPGFANAKIELLFNGAIPPKTYGQNYCLYGSSDGATQPVNVFKSILSSSSVNIIDKTNTISNPVQYSNFSQAVIAINAGTTRTSILSTDVVTFLGVETATDASNLNILVQSLGVMGYNFTDVSNNILETTGTTLYTFSNNGPATNYMYNTLYKKNLDFSSMNAKQNTQMTNYLSYLSSNN